MKGLQFIYLARHYMEQEVAPPRLLCGRLLSFRASMAPTECRNLGSVDHTTVWESGESLVSARRGSILA